MSAKKIMQISSVFNSFRETDSPDRIQFENELIRLKPTRSSESDGRSDVTDSLDGHVKLYCPDNFILP